MSAAAAPRPTSASPCAAALAAALAARAADFKVVAQRSDADGPMQDRALEIVRLFAIERGLILYGGLAIDYALRLKGGGIYPDSQRPDFDMYSPRSVDDAYALADRLHRAGFRQVIAERRIHAQTMHVKVDFVGVADISYAPPEVFARLPTVEFNGVRALHPDAQRLDMHLAFCFPFNGAPREDIFNRWAKDLRRFDLFQALYPVDPAALSRALPAHGGGRPGPEEAQLSAPLGADAAEGPLALHGLAAFGLLQAALRELAAAAGAPPAAGAGAGPPVSVRADGATLAVGLPAAHAGLYGYLAVASPEPEALAAALGRLPGCSVRRFEPYMDAKPRTLVVASRGAAPLHIFSTRGRQLAVVAVRLGGRSVRIVSPQYLLLHFLHEAHQAETAEARALMASYYVWTLELLAAGARLLASAALAAGREEGAAAAGSAAGSAAGAPGSAEAEDRRFDPATLVNSSPFGLTTRVMGEVNHDSAYVIKMALAAGAVKDSPPPALHLEPGLESITVGLPKRYVPMRDRKRGPPTFDYGLNPLFRRTGRLIPEKSG